jgi:hypothetical protein
LDVWPDLPRHTVGFTCPTNTVTCSVKLESVPSNAFDHIGKDIIIDFFAEPYHVPLPVQSFRLKAVAGFGKVSSADRPFATKPLPLGCALAIVRMTGTVSVVPSIVMIRSRLEGQVHQEGGGGNQDDCSGGAGSNYKEMQASVLRRVLRRVLPPQMAAPRCGGTFPLFALNTFAV